MKKDILVMGDPRLRNVSKIVKLDTNYKEIIRDLSNSFSTLPGAGLAAPQIGYQDRIIVVHDGLKKIFMINPEITNQHINYWLAIEACFSIPGVMSNIWRPINISLNYLNEDMEERSMDAEYFLARIILHEIDHLDGIFFIDRSEEKEIKDFMSPKRSKRTEISEIYKRYNEDRKQILRDRNL